MATDRDEQRRQEQELDEIRRSFAEMGARMSLFEPASGGEDEPAPQAPVPTPVAPRAVLPAAPPPPAPPRPRRWAAAALGLAFLAGGVLGFLVPRSQPDADTPPPSSAAASTRAAAAIPAPPPRTRTSVPDSCLETAQLADEVIARLVANIRDNRLSVALKDYTVANQACRKEASP